VDADGKPIMGYTWIHNRIIERPITSSTHTVQPYSSMKECMSAILGLGMPATAVVDDDGRLYGEVRFETIQTISLS
jgi:osmoprotectant transport system ATP-binding protein